MSKGVQMFADRLKRAFLSGRYRPGRGAVVALIRRSGLFDASWYAKVNPDIAGQDPFKHFSKTGFAELRDPLPLFSCAYYLETHQDVRGAGLHPLVHYIKYGGREGRQTHPLFDPDVIREKHPDLCAQSPDIIALHRARVSPYWPDMEITELFDTAYYAAQVAPGDLSGQSPVEHYLSQGAALGLSPHPLFDEPLYRQRYLQDQPEMPGLLHYLTNGREPHITLTPRFADKFYLARYPEVKNEYPRTPLEHYLRHGRQEGRALNKPLWHDDFYTWSELCDAVRTGSENTGSKTPDVSVIIPVYNHFSHTLRCVWSLLRAGDAARLQIIIADDGSDDETEAFFSTIPGLTYIRNTENLGFLKSCNAAAKSAVAPYLFFLNNDTAVRPGAIDALVQTMQSLPDAGLVGAKLIYPDGTLQEAGGYIWRDGSGANLGRHSDPDEPGYNFRRDADYISGAAILIRRDLWQELDGFDPRYAPAYCEDSDFAMRLRNLGWRVVYQPTSEVVHFEGVSSGTSLESGVKSYQVINQEKQLEKWQFALQNHGPNHTVDPRHIPRPPRPRVLFLDAVVPEPDKDSGSFVAFWYMKILIDLGYEVTFAAENLSHGGKYGRALMAMGVEVLCRPYVTNMHSYLVAYAGDFDLFLPHRYSAGGVFIEQMRARAPDTPIIFNTVDLHHLRMQREAVLNGAAPKAMQAAYDVCQIENHYMDIADDTIMISQVEYDILRAEGNKNSLSVIPLITPCKEEVPGFAGRSGIAFIGGYRHTPNVDAVLYFIAEIWPVLQTRAPDLELHIVGSNPPKEILKIARPGIVVHGFIEDLDGFLEQRIATIVPLRYGAGIKGKIGFSLAAGVPCVSTSVGAEGMGLQPGQDILLADDPEGFATHVMRLCDDAKLWRKISQNGQKFIRRSYAPEVIKLSFLRLLAKVSAAPFAGPCPITGAPETRRFLSDQCGDSLAPDFAGPGSCERIAASALLARIDPVKTAIIQLEDGDIPKLALFGKLPNLQAALTGITPLCPVDEAVLALVQVDLKAQATADMAKVLNQLSPACARLIIAAADPAKTPDGARPAPAYLSKLVRQLETAGWEVRCDYLPLKECALTGSVLVEARRSD